MVASEKLINYYYLIFSLPLSGKQTKRGVKFRHSTRNVTKFLRKVGYRVPQIERLDTILQF